MHVELEINRQKHAVDVEPRMTLLDCLRERLLLNGAHAGCEHGVCGACTVLIDGVPVRSCLMFAVQADGYAITTIEGLAPGLGELSLLQDAFCETHGMQCGYCTPAMILAAHALLIKNAAPTREEIVEAISANICRCTGYAQIVEAVALAAERMRGLKSAAGAAMSAPGKFRFISSDRRVREDRRFVVGKGNFAADIAPAGVKNVALVTCPYPAARIVSIDKSAALAMPGVRYVLEGKELAEGTAILSSGLETPKVPRRPLAVDIARYAGEWVVAVVADSRAMAEDAAEAVAVEYGQLPFVLDAEHAYAGGVLVHEAHGSNVLLDRTFVWGEVEKDFAASPHTFKHRVKWGRSATVPIETFGVTASWEPWREMLDVWASIQMPKFPDQLAWALKLPASAVRVHYDVDVGGSYGVKRGIKHAVLVGYLSKRLGCPVRLIEDRLENMRGGDMHGPERLFDVEVAYDGNGIIRSMKMRALDNVGAYAGRSPFQLGKPIGAIVGPYKINSVQYQAIAVLSNKTVQEAVRAFGQSPTNFALERTIDEVANKLGIDRMELRRRNMIRHEEFPYLIPSGSTYDSGNYEAVIAKVFAKAPYEELLAERDRLRGEGKLAGLGIAACLEPSGGNSAFEPLLNPKNETTTWMDSCRISIDLTGAITATMHTTSAGQGHETLVGTVVGEVLEIDPDRVRVTRAELAEFIAEQFAGRQPHGHHARWRNIPCRQQAERQADCDCRA